MTATVTGTAELDALAQQARREIVKAVAHAKGGHLGGPFSATDILTALYFRVMNIRPDEPYWADRDRFILSKGHSCIALYVVMALRGYFPLAEVSHVRRHRFPAAGTPGHEGIARAGYVERLTRARLRGRDRDCPRRQAGRPELPYLRHGRRWRMQRGHHLGRRPCRAALRPRQPRCHRRPEPAAAVRLAGRWHRTAPASV